MKLRFVVSMFAAAALASFALAGVKVPLEEVPKAAVGTIKEKFPKAEIRFVDKEPNGNYEFALKEGDRKLDVGVTAAGKLLNVKEELTEDKLPKAVKEGFLKKYPGAKIVEIEKVISGDGTDARTTFELAIKTDKGNLGVAFDLTGKFVGDVD
jgi:hypothetical protein